MHKGHKKSLLNHMYFDVTCQGFASYCSATLVSDTEVPGSGWLSCHFIEILACVYNSTCAGLDFKKHQHSSSILTQKWHLPAETLSSVYTEKVKQVAQIKRLSLSLFCMLTCNIFLLHAIFNNQKCNLAWYSNYIFVELDSRKHRS